MSTSPEIGKSIEAGGINTNYHDQGEGAPVVLFHGSGPGVSAFANWRLVIPQLSSNFRTIAPDIVGFGFTERPDGIKYEMETWIKHAIDFLFEFMDLRRGLFFCITVFNTSISSHF